MSNYVSIIICCFNSSKVIEKTIRALLLQSLDKRQYEIIVVDNNCTDNTIDIVHGLLKNKGVIYKIIQEPKLGLMYARKAGVRATNNKLILFVDDDNILKSDYLEILVQIYMMKPEVGAVGSNVTPLVAQDTPEWFYNVAQVYACGKQADFSSDVTLSRMVLFGAGLSFRSEIIKDILLDEHELFLIGRRGTTLLRGDDSELCLRCVLLGWRLWYDETLHIQHNILSSRISWDYVKEAVHGGGIASLIIRLYKNKIKEEELPGYFHNFFITLKEYIVYNLVHINRSNKKNDRGINFIHKKQLRGRLLSFVYFGYFKYNKITKIIKKLDKRNINQKGASERV